MQEQSIHRVLVLAFHHSNSGTREKKLLLKPSHCVIQVARLAYVWQTMVYPFYRRMCRLELLIQHPLVLLHTGSQRVPSESKWKYRDQTISSLVNRIYGGDISIEIFY